jgi:hypothetical protein
VNREGEGEKTEEKGSMIGLTLIDLHLREERGSQWGKAKSDWIVAAFWVKTKNRKTNDFFQAWSAPQKLM